MGVEGSCEGRDVLSGNLTQGYIGHKKVKCVESKNYCGPFVFLFTFLFLMVDQGMLG